MRPFSEPWFCIAPAPWVYMCDCVGKFKYRRNDVLPVRDIEYSQALSNPELVSFWRVAGEIWVQENVHGSNAAWPLSGDGVMPLGRERMARSVLTRKHNSQEQGSRAVAKGQGRSYSSVYSKDSESKLAWEEGQ